MDEAFWQKIFSLHGRRAKCKSSGSKQELLELADVVLNNQIDNLILALDRDYDDPWSMRIDHPKILYTYGYSWESDVISSFDFEIAFSIFGSAANLEEMEVNYRDFIIRQSNVFRRAAYLDAKCHFHECTLFDRTKPMSIIIAEGGKEPKLDRKKIVSATKKMHPFCPVRFDLSLFVTSNGLEIFFGKAASHLIFQWFYFAASKLGERRNVRYSSFMNLLISMFSLDDRSNSRNVYYRAMMGQI
ncbi:MAG: hypothetical protein OXF89_02060 [Rhodospirillaceae bacterium]|nr:hypothetical protein [Rhodospirillaceae bacterium]